MFWGKCRNCLKWILIIDVEATWRGSTTIKTCSKTTNILYLKMFCYLICLTHLNKAILTTTLLSFKIFYTGLFTDQCFSMKLKLKQWWRKTQKFNDKKATKTTIIIISTFNPKDDLPGFGVLRFSRSEGCWVVPENKIGSSNPKFHNLFRDELKNGSVWVDLNWFPFTTSLFYEANLGVFLVTSKWASSCKIILFKEVMSFFKIQHTLEVSYFSALTILTE